LRCEAEQLMQEYANASSRYYLSATWARNWIAIAQMNIHDIN